MAAAAAKTASAAAPTPRILPMASIPLSIGIPGAYNPAKLTNNPGGVQPNASFKPAQQLPGVDNGADANGSMYMMGPHFGKAPRVYSYNLTLQKEFHNWLFEGAYEGERSVGLSSSAYLNTLPTSFLYLGTAGPARRIRICCKRRSSIPMCSAFTTVIARRAPHRCCLTRNLLPTPPPTCSAGGTRLL